MNAKEKALEFVNKFHQHAKGQTDEVRWIHAKSCAIIAVDEVIESIEPILIIAQRKSKMIMSDLDYWQQVKQEIEKL